MMDLSDYHIATKQIHELREQLRATEDLCQSLVKRIQEGMHWLPMTDDAVFEDKAEYLIRVVDEPLAIVCTYRHKMQLPFVSEIMDYERKEVTHYARITEPNK
jgi:hypothetical protein